MSPALPRGFFTGFFCSSITIPSRPHNGRRSLLSSFSKQQVSGTGGVVGTIADDLAQRALRREDAIDFRG